MPAAHRGWEVSSLYVTPVHRKQSLLLSILKVTCGETLPIYDDILRFYLRDSTENGLVIMNRR